MKDASSIPIPSERIASRVIDGQAVVIVMDTQRVHTLNPVASRIWELMDGRDIASIAEIITKEFDVDAQQARRDVVSFIEELENLNAIEIRRPA